MPFKNAKLYKKSSTKPKTKARVKRSPTLSSVKKIVKAVIARDVETKSKQLYDESQNIYPADSPSWLGSIFPVSPYTTFLDISQGTGEGQRIGNVIKTKSLFFKGIIWPAAYNVTTNLDPQPTIINMWIICDKEGPTQLPSSDIDSQFIQLGNSAQGLTDSLIDGLATVNTDRYRVFAKRTFKLGYAAYTGTSFDADRQQYANNDFKMSCKFNINLTKHMVKKVRFNDNNTIPLTRGLFCVLQSIYANGSVIATTQRVAALAYTLDYKYEDA